MSEVRPDADESARLNAEVTAIEQAMQEAVNDAVLLHKRLGLPMVVWENGRVVWIPADQLTIDAPQSAR